MTEDNLVPSPLLIKQWRDEWFEGDRVEHSEYSHVARQAARWGADQELEACCELMDRDFMAGPSDLRAARRPKPPSAVAQAEALIERYEDGWCPSPAQWHVIREGLAEGRRALEALPND
jgi:hypothetical protein